MEPGAFHDNGESAEVAGSITGGGATMANRIQLVQSYRSSASRASASRFTAARLASTASCRSRCRAPPRAVFSASRRSRATSPSTRG
jgi:hypothetical protein